MNMTIQIQKNKDAALLPQENLALTNFQEPGYF